MLCSKYTTSAVISLAAQKIGNCVSLNGTSSGAYEVDFPVGKYKIELWGAAGGNSTHVKVILGGLGAYVSGILDLQTPRVFYFFVGTAGENSAGSKPGSGGFNGGVNGAFDNYNNNCPSGGSGGSSDMRITKGSFDANESLLSRIMVAGGGGSSGCYAPGGKGGSSGINGSSGFPNKYETNMGGLGGTQNQGFSLGIGGVGYPGSDAGGSGGGGYWGGYGGMCGQGNGAGGGGGGSSYVSGHSSCIAIDSTKSPLPSSIHPSLFSFKSPLIISGGEPIPSFEYLDQNEISGNNGNGGARITLLSHLKCLTNKPYFTISFLHLFFLVFFFSH